MTPIRHAGRALVLDEHDRVLLFRFRDPGRERDHLASPGGRVENGEVYEDAVRREIAEELLLDDVDLGPAIWHRTCEFDFLGTWTRVEERSFLVRIEASALGPYGGHLTNENVVAREWWTLEEIDTTSEAVWLSELASLARAILRDGAASAPIAIGP